jgi:hypothetical protein
MTEKYISFFEDELTYKQRENLPDSAFVFPKERGYPIHDVEHARNALARVAQNGTSEEKAKVRSAVSKKYPSIEIKECAYLKIHKILQEDILQSDVEAKLWLSLTIQFGERKTAESVIKSNKNKPAEIIAELSCYIFKNYASSVDKMQKVLNRIFKLGDMYKRDAAFKVKTDIIWDEIK